MEENPVNSQSKSDPVELLTIGDEVYQLIYDYSVAKAIARHLGVNPMFNGILPVMEHPDGFEVALWAMISQCGKKHTIPEFQRNLKLSEVKEWFEEGGFEFVDKVTETIAKCIRKGSPKSTDRPPEGENSNPPVQRIQ